MKQQKRNPCPRGRAGARGLQGYRALGPVACQVSLNPPGLELVLEGLHRADLDGLGGGLGLLLDHLAGERVADHLAAADGGLLDQGHLHQADEVEGALLLDFLDHDVGRGVEDLDDLLARQAGLLGDGLVDLALG